MPKNIYILTFIFYAMIVHPLYGQSLFSTRVVALGAYSAAVRDVRGFDHNPAGLVNIRDWDFTMSTYVSTTGGGDGFVFQGLAFGKRILEGQAVAAQYSPGSILQFVIPTTVVLVDSTPIAVDQRVVYEDQLALGYGVRVTENVSLGIGAHLRSEKVKDTQYALVELDTLSFITSSEVTAENHAWLFDVGVLWNPLPELTLSGVGRNILVAANGFPEELQRISLPATSTGELGFAYAYRNMFQVTGEFTSASSGAFGFEFFPGVNLAIRGGMYVRTSESPFVQAIAGGVGWSYQLFDIDAGYLRFIDQGNRGGAFSVSEFQPSRISNVDLNPFTRDRVSLSVKAKLGAVRESVVRIEAVEMFGGIYPAALDALAFQPVGKVRVKNISSKPIYAKARFMVEKYMDAPTESESVYIAEGEEKELPFAAVFNETMRGVPQMLIRDGTVFVNATPAEEYDDKIQTRVLIHGRNDWDGNVYSLRHFVTPNDPDVLRFGRDMLMEERDSIDDAPKDLHVFQKARVLLNAFAGKLMYVSDPRQTADYVQYPSETLRQGSGDCDDMTVCFSSLLNSIGVSTAFVDVVPRDRPQESHIYLLFDTGVEPKYGDNIASNPKRYLVRKSGSGAETIWIPIETTVINRGFEEAWSSGAQKYFDDVEIGLGLAKGWVKIIDVY